MTEGDARETELETSEWRESLDDVLAREGPERVRALLHDLQVHAQKAGVRLPFSANTPYINTIPPEDEAPYPGSREIELRIKSLIRWNAMAMVVRANREEHGIGGHISSYASAATLYEVGFNHFFHGKGEHFDGDQIYFQGHSAPGIYARAFLEGRLSARQMENFRRELRTGGGLSSYPHPWLMPEFWEFPTVSMGLAPIMAIYQARFNHYLVDRGLHPKTDHKVWAFLGDGECDEPESLGAITLAAREGLDNLIFVVNCNLQRLDGPVRGNGNIIQELEAAFRGAGWNCIKVIWGSDWDPLLAADTSGALVRRMGEMVDGERQRIIVESGSYIRDHFFNTPELRQLAEHLSDEQLRKMRLGGHDPVKVYNAYRQAATHPGAPTVILARTIKGYGLGEGGEGRNITHQQKKLNEDELRTFRTRFGIPISDEQVAEAPFYRPPDSSPEISYLKERRAKLGGFVPARTPACQVLKSPQEQLFEELYSGSAGREVSTTMAMVRLLTKLLKHNGVGKLVVPIIPDEARTFGMESLFRQVGIYSHAGQLYEPVDAETLLYYREARSGQILEEGITEAGSMADFIAAGTAYSTHCINTIPFFFFYSMFGFQRAGDLIWAAGDMRCRGFMVGGTAGRTTLAGEGLQHQDGNTQLYAYVVPNLLAYDPAYAFEIAVIVREGIRRMYEQQENVFYYLTVYNENYVQPPMPEDAREGILRGVYRLKRADFPKARHRAQLLASGPIVNEALRAQAMLGERFAVAADVWSVTSFKQLYADAIDAERWNRLHPNGPARTPFVAQALSGTEGSYVLASDYVKAVPLAVAPFLPRPPAVLGTDGFGRSEGRRALRNFFEVDARALTIAALDGLRREGALSADDLARAVRELDIHPDRANPRTT